MYPRVRTFRELTTHGRRHLLSKTKSAPFFSRRSAGCDFHSAPRSAAFSSVLWVSCLTNRAATQIVPVPLEFASPRDYCALIAHNLLAEFWHVYREGCRGPEFRATVVSSLPSSSVCGTRTSIQLSLVEIARCASRGRRWHHLKLFLAGRKQRAGGGRCGGGWDDAAFALGRRLCPSRDQPGALHKHSQAIRVLALCEHGARSLFKLFDCAVHSTSHSACGSMRWSCIAKSNTASVFLPSVRAVDCVCFRRVQIAAAGLRPTVASRGLRL